jgi:hypothetical protein
VSRRPRLLRRGGVGVGADGFGAGVRRFGFALAAGIVGMALGEFDGTLGVGALTGLSMGTLGGGAGSGVFAGTLGTGAVGGEGAGVLIGRSMERKISSS